MTSNDNDSQILIKNEENGNGAESCQIEDYSLLLQQQKKLKPSPNIILLTFEIIKWNFVLYWIILICLYSSFLAFFTDDQTHGHLNYLQFLCKKKPLVILFGVYIIVALKKFSDVNSNIPSTDKITNLVSITVKNRPLQKAIMEHVCTSLAIVFHPLSPMISKRIPKTERNVRPSHSKLIKWTLDAIRHAQQQNEVDSNLVLTLVNDLCLFHSQCDRVTSFSHGMFSKSLTIALKIQNFWIGLYYATPFDGILQGLATNVLVFTVLLIALRWTEQILKPYCESHDVFELNQILNNRLENASDAVNEECGLLFETAKKRAHNGEEAARCFDV